MKAGRHKRVSNEDLEANVHEEQLKVRIVICKAPFSCAQRFKLISAVHTCLQNQRGWRLCVLMYQSIGVVYGGLGESYLP